MPSQFSCRSKTSTDVPGFSKYIYNGGVMKIAVRVLLICLFAVLCVCNWTYPGYCQDKTRKDYYPNGALKFEVNLKNGRPEGKGKAYYQSGKVFREYNYKAGKREGIGKMYYENGKVWAEKSYKNNNQEGIEKIYNRDGQLFKEKNYKNNKQEGIEKIYAGSGKLIREYNYKAGKKISAVCYDEQGNKIECPNLNKK
jgi:antitoxin component YwqK of YwqJK toxin-antitoxin module